MEWDAVARGMRGSGWGWLQGHLWDSPAPCPACPPAVGLAPTSRGRARDSLGTCGPADPTSTWATVLTTSCGAALDRSSQARPRAGTLQPVSTCPSAAGSPALGSHSQHGHTGVCPKPAAGLQDTTLTTSMGNHHGVSASLRISGWARNSSPPFFLERWRCPASLTAHPCSSRGWSKAPQGLGPGPAEGRGAWGSTLRPAS